MECVGIEVYWFNIKFTVHSLRKHLKSLCILLFSAIAMQIYLMIDTLMLGFMSTYTEVGLYSSAIKSIRIVMPVTIALSVVLLPRLSYLAENGSKEDATTLLNKAFDVIMLFAIPLAFFFFFISDKFVPFFFGVISTYGAIGASIASLIGELAVTFVSFYFVYRNGLYKLRWSYLFKCVFSGISFFMIYRFMIPAGLTPLCWLIVFSLLSWCWYFLIQLLVFKNTYCLMIIKTFQYNMLK